MPLRSGIAPTFRGTFERGAGRPGDAPGPAHFGPIGADNPERLKLAGTYDKHWVDHVSPLRPDDFNPLFNCDAPADQRFDGFLKGGESVSVTGMCRSGQPVEGTLPGIRVRAFVQRETDGSLTETTMVCDTATLFPNVGKAVMAFRGLVKSTDRLGEDISAVLLAVEHGHAAPRPAEYYHHVFQLRTDPEQAYKHALSDHQLMSETDSSIQTVKRQERMKRAVQDRRKFLADSDWMVRKTVAETGLPADIVPPSDPDRGADIQLTAALSLPPGTFRALRQGGPYIEAKSDSRNKWREALKDLPRPVVALSWNAGRPGRVLDDYRPRLEPSTRPSCAARLVGQLGQGHQMASDQLWMVLCAPQRPPAWQRANVRLGGFAHNGGDFR